MATSNKGLNLRELLYGQRRQGVEPYWYVIALFSLAAGALYIYHLSTGFVPDRVAIAIEAFDFGIYWYGIIITGGIALGSYVVSRLAGDRALALLRKAVPAAVRNRPVQELDLSSEIEQILEKSGARTVGELLLRGAFGPANLGLNDEGWSQVRRSLQQDANVKEAWIDRPPWAQWNPDHVWNGLIWCLVLAVVGARLYHVFTPSPSMAEVGITSPADYFRNPLQLINLRNGGLGIYGGIAGGALGLFIYTYRQRISAIAWADLAVIGVALGQFIGRWGNFFNQELYGRPTELPWAVRIEPAYRLPGYTDFNLFHPAFLYESIWNLFVFVVLLTLEKRYRNRVFSGDIMAAYLILYGIGRILMETIRLDSRTFSMGGIETGLPIASLVSILVALIMGSWIVMRHRLSRA